MSKRKTEQEVPVCVKCKHCRTIRQLSRSDEVIIFTFKHTPWFDSFEWYCFDCQTPNREFFDNSVYSYENVDQIAPNEFFKTSGNPRLAREYEKATGVYMPAPDCSNLELVMARSMIQLIMCFDISSIGWD